ncbi:inositol-pentakisphosphate 2-kinase-like isoform X1 [Benincasa hispida]|uniref:inositol-pentakisphosphate 2-kinase-like isoform X1 n=1 Tax=Benincasa hispida TaxID=102211 RepID=UPI0019027B8A|nr:inositol-pentakisphosphate 2-kinase-like isoform X1 [Benincasa hispida]XP_038898786.1 inositol-pentakisphosphate 2-kinase-like isoform X1 [Benincasa hispida]XP_038898787.1 inositol-pentakisphosphate 2-kinase-like isoform X1 [Benincasa hispida]XP_038898788.1 inositol-pentakisphosphate 2-kinase-like isoform X1 [Benincasa hispida]XP_038898789.1 inositol-pentakisphosphate 2-kinase-like isoform X1 [Benincasa hispida]
MEIVLEQKDAADWTYRGEGAVNLVLAYTGSSPLFLGKVIRIQKAPRNGSHGTSVRNLMALSAHERLLWRDVGDLVSCTDRDVVCQIYVQHVMIPLLDSKHVDAGVHVLVTREFLETIEKNILSQRPAWRVSAGRVNIHCDFVLLQSDHSIFPQGGEGEFCISVEIKPKWGCLPTSRFISKRNAIKKSVTRFRMHQALKLQKGEISELSDYDPLDLFSGSQDRIYKAIKDLFSTPQNNFRVFLNGSLVLGASGGYAVDTNLAIEEAFEDALQSVIQRGNGLRTMTFLQLVAEAVYRSGCLNRLLEVQKLDSFDIEGAIHAYYDVISEPCLVCRHMNDDEWLNRCATLHSAHLDQSLEIVRNYLIAATAKDCSLMITFRPWHVDCPGSTYNSIFVESTKQTFDYKVNFIDLDLKPFKKMEEYYEQDNKIVRNYTQMFVTELGADNYYRPEGL